MRISLRTEWPQWVLIVAMFAAATVCWPLAPERIPVHWDVHGQVDRLGGRFEAFALLPLCALGVYCLMLVLPMIDPGRANYARFGRAYAAIRLAILTVLAVLYGMLVLAAFGVAVRMNLMALLMLGAMFIVIGNYMGKLRPNWFVGIRTPWTLSSKLSWTRTHRAGGWVFIASGLLTLAAACLPDLWGLVVAIGSAVIGSLGLAVYSYLVWRRDPDRVPPAGTAPGEP